MFPEQTPDSTLTNFPDVLNERQMMDHGHALTHSNSKCELQKHLGSEGLLGNIVSVENAGILTDPQIITRVEKRFPARSQYDIF